MADVVVTSPRGLRTETGNIAGPEPQLTRADNVVTRRPGLVEPRGQLRGYLRMSSATACPDAGYVRHARRWRMPNDSFHTLYYWTGAASDVFRCRPIPGGLVTGGFTTTGRTQEPRSADLGDRQAWTLDCGIGMVDDTYQVTRPPGAPQGLAPSLQPLVSGTPAKNWFPATGSVAYRVCFVQYVNGIPIRSAPSPRVVLRQNGGTACYVRVWCLTANLLQNAQAIEIYRTQVTTVADADPGDEMRLRYSIESGSFAALDYLDDFLDDDSWNGPALYTNETQQGLAQSNWRPNNAADVTTYNGMTFYAGVTSHPTLTATLRTTGSATAPSESMQSVAFDGTLNSDNTITGIAAGVFPFLAVGQVVMLMASVNPPDGDTSFAALTKIVTLDSGAGSVTLDKDTLTTGATQIVAWDWFRLRTAQGVERYCFASITQDFATGTPPSYADYFGQAPVFLAQPSDATDPGWAGGAGNVVATYDIGADGCIALAVSGPANACYLRMDGFDITPQLATATTLKGMTFRWFIDVYPEYESSTYPPDVTFDLTSTKPAAWDVGNVAFTADVGVPSVVDGAINRLAYSKLYEPEALPPVNNVDIGKAAYPIRRVVATTDSLWIFKGDGLWRMYGATPETLSVQQVDPTCQLFGRQDQRFDRWVTKLGDMVFAWTSRGILAISSNGIQQIDADIRSLVRRYTPTQGQTVTYPWSWSSLQTGMVCFGFKAHEYSDIPLGFMFDTVSGTFTVLRSDNGTQDTDVLTVHHQPVTINGAEVTI